MTSEALFASVMDDGAAAVRETSDLRMRPNQQPAMVESDRPPRRQQSETIEGRRVALVERFVTGFVQIPRSHPSILASSQSCSNHRLARLPLGPFPPRTRCKPTRAYLGRRLPPLTPPLLSSRIDETASDGPRGAQGRRSTITCRRRRVVVAERACRIMLGIGPRTSQAAKARGPIHSQKRGPAFQRSLLITQRLGRVFQSAPTASEPSVNASARETADAVVIAWPAAARISRPAHVVLPRENAGGRIRAIPRRRSPRDQGYASAPISGCGRP